MILYIWTIKVGLLSQAQLIGPEPIEYMSSWSLLITWQGGLMFSYPCFTWATSLLALYFVDSLFSFFQKNIKNKLDSRVLLFVFCIIILNINIIFLYFKKFVFNFFYLSSDRIKKEKENLPYDHTSHYRPRIKMKGQKEICRGTWNRLFFLCPPYTKYGL